jgi:hypothetical protein
VEHGSSAHDHYDRGLMRMQRYSGSTAWQGIAYYIRGVPPWRLVLWVIGTALFFGGGGWRLSGVGVVGGVLVAVAVIQLPWGVGSYRRRCAGIAADAARAIENTSRLKSEQLQQHVKEVRALPVTDRFAQEGEAWVALLETAEALQGSRSTSLPERSAELMHFRIRSEAMYADLTARARTEDERRYCAVLSSVMIANNRMTDSQMQEVTRILGELARHLEQLRPPARIRAAHDAMCQAFREELEALSEYYAAVVGSDAEAVRVAAMAYQNAAQVCYARLNGLGVRTASQLPRRAT